MRGRDHHHHHGGPHGFHHRHQHGHPFGERGFHGRGDVPLGRKLSSEDLQLIILALLAEKEAHGYELIKAIAEHSSGFYSPSPGVIYPALMYLHEIEYAKVDQDGTRKCYGLTAGGKAYLAENRAQADRILEMLARMGGRMADVRDAYTGANEFEADNSDEVHRARHAFKDALRSKRGCGPEEAARIVKILDRATREILAKPASSKS